MSEPAWILQQRKAFTGWCNVHLSDRLLKINTLEEDLQDGVILHELMEIISSKKIKLEAKTPKSKFQKIGNLNLVFDFLHTEKIKLVNIGSEDIFGGNSKLILGFIWTLILRYQIQKGGSTEPKQELLDWVNATLEKAGSDKRVHNFTNSWSDGKAFVDLVNYLRPNTVTPTGEPVPDMKHAFAVAEKELQIPNLLDAEFVATDPDEHSVMTYVSYFRNKEPLAKSDADASMTRASGKGVKRAHVGKPANFKVTTKNTAGKLVDVHPDNLKIAVTCNDQPVDLQRNATTKGRTRVTYVAPAAGTAKVEVLLDGAQIHDSPFTVEVREKADAAVAANCRAYGPGLKAAQVGHPAPFTVVARDADGNKVADQIFDVEVLDHEGNPVDTVKVADNGDGTYPVTYQVAAPGNYQVFVELEGEPLKGSPFNVVAGNEPVNNQEVSAANSKAHGPGLERPKEQEKTHFTVETFDKNNTKMAVGGYEVAADVSGGEHPQTAVKDNHDGTYTVEYTPTKPGALTVEVEGEPVQGSPFSVSVKPIVAGAKAHGPGLEHPHPAQPTHFTVEASDKDGQPIKDVDVKVTINGPNGPEDAQSNYNPDGTTNVAYTPKNKGKYEIAVEAEGFPVPNSPFTVIVTPDSDASKSEASGPGLESPSEDVPTNFTVHVKNSNGEQLKEGGSQITVKFDGPGHYDIAVTDHNNGVYDVVYTPTQPGQYKVNVLVDGKPVNKSPFDVEVKCSADASKCVAHGPGLEKAEQYKKANFTIQAKDKNGENMKVGGNGFVVKVTGPNESLDGKVHDNEDGTYNVEYEPEEEGDHKVEVSLEGAPIHGSAFHVPTAVATANGAHSEAEGKGLKKAVVGHKGPFVVTLKDNKGKPVRGDDNKVEVHVAGPQGAVEVHSEKKDNSKFDYHYRPVASGDHTVTVKVNGDDVKGSPFQVKVKDQSKLKISGKGTSVAFNTTPAKFNIEARDEAGNPVNDDEFEVTLKNANGDVVDAQVTIGEPKDGVYPVQYQLKDLGKYELNVKYGDDNVDAAPYQVTCKNGAKPEKTIVSKWSFTITARTADEELVDEEEDDFQVKIDGPVEVEAKVKPLGKGKYRVTYKPSKEGQYNIHITLGGVPIVGSPFVQNF